MRLLSARSRFIMLAATVSLAVPGCQQAKPVSEVAQDRWIEARTDNFIVVSNAGEARARAIIEDLEEFRRFAIHALDMQLEQAPLPFTIYAVSSGSDLQALVNSPDVFSVFQTSYRGGLAVVNVNARGPDGTDDLQITYTKLGPIYHVSQNMRTIGLDGVFHEYVHYLQALDHKRRYPLWYTEGYAEYLSTFAVSSTGDYRVGAPPMHRVRELQLAEKDRAWIPVGSLLNATGYDTGHGRGSFYGQAWLMTHYLLADPERRALLETFLSESNQPTVDPTAVFEKVFGVSADAFGSRLRQYLRGERFKSERFERPDEPLQQPFLSEVAPDDIRIRLGYALLHFSVDLDKAEVLMNEAVAINPDSLRARVLLASLAFARGDHQRVARLVKDIGEAGAQDVEFLTLKGHMAVRQAVEHFKAGSEKWPQDIAEAQDSFRRAAAVDPHAAEAKIGLARSYLLYDAPPPDEAVEAVEQALQLIPSSFDSYLLLGHLQFRRGEIGAARENYQQVIAWSRDPDSRRLAREMVEEIDAIIARLSKESADAAP